MSAARTLPAGTYRVQIRPDFDLDVAAELVPYLAALGASHLYSAPLLAAVPGSAHGYDVVDPARTNPELGGIEALRRLADTLREHDLRLVADIVPNHQGVRVPDANPAWWGVLRHGRDSAYARWFDVDWDRGPLVIPVLADDDAALDDLVVDGEELRYFEHRYPIAPGTGDGTAREVHERQHYRLVDWRRGDTDLTYRRFFAVNDLAAVRVEDPDVFEATHAEIRRWLEDDLVDAIRVDHPDGLRNPGRYLRRLRDLIGERWLVVEKILAPGEPLPSGWPVDGTTGYDALREVCDAFIDPDGADWFAPAEPLLDVATDAKREIASRLFATEITRMLRTAPALADLPEIRDALVEIAAQMPVYRTYLAEPDGLDHLRRALAAAYPRYSETVAALDEVLLDPSADIAIRFEQFTGAVMAKGVEDTAFYRWNRFVALNEVGGSPERFGITPEEFHAAATDRQRYWPTSMTTLSTHDTKRGEDVRARLAVLSEIGPAWQEAYARWTVRHPLDDPDLAALLWQTVVGVWPIERERLHAYAEKAAREASTSTRWNEPNATFERALHDVIDAMYDDEDLRADIDDFVAGITPAGWSNSLGQKLIQLAMPGVPDVYQGTELWDNSLVDPDNRRDVDFVARAYLLGELDGGVLPVVDSTGAAKLLVTSRALRLRREFPELFTAYLPMHARGPHARHVLAFDRGGAIAVATRLPVGLAADGGWSDDDRIVLPSGAWRDTLTGIAADGETRLSDLLAHYPVALLAQEST
ncbi:MAG TPA: malto-oligosyltrehalose synthase [Micromonosporaceae bacterium]